MQIPSSTPGLPPRDFTYVVTFTNPFVYAGNGPLCWDMRISNRSSGASFLLDYAQTSTNPAPTIVPFGAGCKATGVTSRMTLAATGAASMPTNDSAALWQQLAGFRLFGGVR